MVMEYYHSGYMTWHMTSVILFWALLVIIIAVILFWLLADQVMKK